MHTTSTKSASDARDHTGEIGMLAYHLWQQSGRPPGQDVHFWLQAERQLLGTPTPASKPRRQAKPATTTNPSTLRLQQISRNTKGTSRT